MSLKIDLVLANSADAKENDGISSRSSLFAKLSVCRYLDERLIVLFMIIMEL